MFYVAEAFLDGEGLHFTKHSAVIAEFGRLFAKTGRVPSEYHVFLKEAQHDRLGADYADLSTLTQEETQEHLEHAESFLRLAGNLIGSAEAPLRGLTDPDVLKAAADSNRIPVTHDRRTTPGHFAAFIANQTSPGVIVIPKDVPIGVAVEELSLIWASSQAEEWHNRLIWIPL